MFQFWRKPPAFEFNDKSRSTFYAYLDLTQNYVKDQRRFSSQRMLWCETDRVVRSGILGKLTYLMVLLMYTLTIDSPLEGVMCTKQMLCVCNEDNSYQHLMWLDCSIIPIIDRSNICISTSWFVHCVVDLTLIVDQLFDIRVLL